MFEKLNPIDMVMKSSGMGWFPWYGTIIDDDGCSDDAAKLANMSNFDVPPPDELEADNVDDDTIAPPPWHLPCIDDDLDEEEEPAFFFLGWRGYCLLIR